MSENASERVWIRASPEILAELRKDWSLPVQAHADVNADGSWEITFRLNEADVHARLIRAEAEEKRLREAIEAYLAALDVWDHASEPEMNDAREPARRAAVAVMEALST